MIVKLPFGTELEALDLRGLRVRPLAPTAPPDGRDPGALVADAVDRPVDGRPLAELAAGTREVVLVVPDWTRPLPLPEILPVLLSRLQRAGVADHRITVLVASGTHPGIAGERLRELLGPLPEGIRVRQHDSRDEGGLAAVGELRPGVPLRLDRETVEADLVVTIGAVRHHYFAGFGGGAKMVFPGIAGYREIQANHGLVLRPEEGRWRPDERCRAGILADNPVAEEIDRAVSNRPPDFSICTVPGSDGGVAWAAGGPWRRTFEAAVDTAREWFEVGGVGPFDLMVASGGGAPGDSTLIQAHKALDAACEFLAPGGELLFAAAIDRGLGSQEMEPFVDDPRPQAIMERLASDWVQYGHTALRIVDKTTRFSILLRSRFDPASAAGLGFHPVDELETVLERWREEAPGATVGVMSGAAVYPRR